MKGDSMKRLFENVISRNELILDYKQYNYTAALISLWTPGDWIDFQETEPEIIKSYNKARDYFETSIRQDFWDTEDNVPGYETISAEQAKELVDFIKDNRDRTFIIHCDAGQSRSAGVALAIECILNHAGDRYQAGLSSSFTDGERYSPNRCVFDKIMTAWQRYGSA